jgi:hypothetical protein
MPISAQSLHRASASWRGLKAIILANGQQDLSAEIGTWLARQMQDPPFFNA